MCCSRGKIISKIISLVLCAVIITMSVPDSVYAEKTTIETIKDKAIEKADQLKDSAVNGTEQALDKADKLKKDALKGTEQAKDAMSGVANSAKDGAISAYDQSSKYVNNIITKIDAQKFKNGWDTATKFATANMSAQMGSAYVTSVQNAITNAQKKIVNTVNNNRTLASNTGFVAEEWHTSTFNIDATAGGSKYSAVRPDSNGKASSDVKINKNGKTVQEIGLKYYKDGTNSAKAQSKTIMQNYNEYCAKADKAGTKKMTFDEYLDSNVKLKDAYKVLDSEYASEYAGQTRLIPADQMDEAAAYLRKKI